MFSRLNFNYFIIFLNIARPFQDFEWARFKFMKPNTKQFITYGIVAVVLVSFVLIVMIYIGNYSGEAGKISASSYSASALTVVEENFDFGVIAMKDGNVSHKFELKNEGQEPLKIEKVFTSCMCTTAYVIDGSGGKRGIFGMQGHGLSPTTSIEVKAGETITLEAIFNPAAHGPQGTGKIKRLVYVDTNSQTKPKLQVSFEADVIN